MFLRYASILVLILLAAVQPASAQSHNAGYCEAWSRYSPVFKSFIASNPSLAEYSYDDQVQIFADRGIREWDLLNDQLAGYGLSVFNTQELQPRGAVDYDDLEQLALGANPLVDTRMALNLYYHQSIGNTSQDTLEVLAARDRQGIRPLPPLAYLAGASAAFAEGDLKTANEYATKALRQMEGSAQRKKMGGAYYGKILEIAAETESQLARNSKGRIGGGTETDKKRQANRETAAMVSDRGRAQLLSPFADFAALLPGFQAAAPFAWRGNQTVYQSPIERVFPFGVAAASFPISNGKAWPVKAKTGIEILRQFRDCTQASIDALTAGDFEIAATARRTATNLVTPGNVTRVIDDLYGDESDDGEVRDEMESLLDDIGGLPEYLTTAGFVLPTMLVEGDLARFADQLDLLTKPASAKRIMASYAKGYEKDADGDEEMLARLKRLKEAQGDILAAASHMAVALRNFFGEPATGDAARLRDAARWLSGPGYVRLRKALDEDYVKNLKDDSDFARTDREERLGGGAALYALGWAAAYQSGDTANLRGIEIDSLNKYEQEFKAAAPEAYKRLSGDFALLKSNGVVDAKRYEAAARISTAIITELFMSKEYEDEDDEPSGDIAAAMFMIPPAAKLGEWNTVRALGKPALAWYESEDSDLSDPDSNQKQIISIIGGQAVAGMVNAELRQGSAARANALFDLFFTYDFGDAGTLDIGDEEGGDEDAASMLVADELFDAGISARLASRQPKEALVLSLLHNKKYDRFVAAPPSLTPFGFNLPYQDPRRPYEQLFAIARQLPPNDLPWDPMINALNNGRRSDVGDTLLLRAAAQTAGPVSIAAYEKMIAAEAGMRQPDSIIFDSFTKQTGQKQDIADRMSASYDAAISKSKAYADAQRAFRETLPAELRARLTSGASLADLRSSLRSDEVLIATQVSGDDVAIVAVTRDAPPALHWSTLSYSKELAPMIRELEKQMELPSSYIAAKVAAPDERHLKGVYQALLGPVDTVIREKSHILWSPDLKMANLPIAALQSPSGFGKIPYLGLARAVSFVPKLSAFSVSRSAGDQRGNGAIALGDIPYGTAKSSESGTLSLSSYRATPFAAQTMARFGQVTRGELFAGPRATRAALLSASRARRDIMMFYTHGSAGSANQPPSLILGAGTTDKVEMLTSADILRMPASARLVLLAACSTGDTGGDALQPYGGLVSSFLARGSRAVLTAQNPVDEESTSTLMNALVPLLQSGIAPSEALRQAMYALSQRPEGANPIFWAQFVWVGDGG